LIAAIPLGKVNLHGKNQKSKRVQNYFAIWSKSCETTTQSSCRQPTLRAKKTKGYQKAVLSPENYAFEKLKNPADFACRKSLEKLDKDSEKDKEIARIARKILKNNG
jgi:hypothetical protein